jgi:hypothetical protein
VGNNGVNKWDLLGQVCWGQNPAGWWENNSCPDDGSPFAPTDSLPPCLWGIPANADLNQNRWFEMFFESLIELNKTKLSNRIKSAAMGDCCNRSSSYDIEPINDYYPSSDNILLGMLSLNLEVGRANSEVDNLNVTWADEGNGWFSFNWTTDMIITDTLGYSTGGNTMWNEELMYHTLGSGGCGLMANRRIVRARWGMSGEGRCCCEE